MIQRFETKGLLYKTTFAFDETNLYINEFSPLEGNSATTYRLDEISHRFDKRSTNHFNLFLIVFIFLLLGLIVLGIIRYSKGIYIAGIIALIFWFFLRTRVIRHHNLELKTKNGPIKMYLDAKNGNEGLTFMQNLIQASKDYLLKKYGYLDPDMAPEKQFENYRWLLQNHIISEEKFLELKSNLKEALQQKEDQ